MRLPPCKSVLAFFLLGFACDPGSNDPQDNVGTGGTPGTTQPTQPAIPAIYTLPDSPPGEVDMTPPDPETVDVFEQNKALGRGINLGNALDAPQEGTWGPKLGVYMFQATADEGFDSIRLPVRWSAHAAMEAPYTIEKSLFDRVDWAIAHALTRGLKIVVDIHHFGNTDEEGIYDKPEKYHERFLGLWKQIAEHYQDYPKELYFEVLNEPRGALEPYWNEYLAEAVAIIRETNPGRTLVIGGGEWNKYYKLSSVEFPDENIIATFHYYNPYCFTHQNQYWEPVCRTPDGSDPKDAGIASWPVIWPKLDNNPERTEAASRKQIETDMAEAANWSSANHRPLYLGEFGVSSDANNEARADWTASVVKAATKYGMSIAYWQFTSDMGIWSTPKAAFDPLMLKALKTESDDASNGGAGGTSSVGVGGAGGEVGAGGSSGGTTSQASSNNGTDAGAPNGGSNN